eukprot:scaffold93244_cov44-Tisochrysis_lutea.AAC.1
MKVLGVGVGKFYSKDTPYHTSSLTPTSPSSATSAVSCEASPIPLAGCWGCYYMAILSLDGKYGIRWWGLQIQPNTVVFHTRTDVYF